jgi:glutamine cyclotransferase
MALVVGCTSPVPTRQVEVVPSPLVRPPADTARPVPSATASPIASPTPGSASPIATPSGAIPTFTYEVVQVFPHDRGAFTEGLVFQGGFFYESTGLQGRSSLRRVEPETGQVLQLYTLAPEYFGEGIALYDNKIAQLTWQSHIGFVYDKDSFDVTGTFRYPSEGWGLTYDGTQLIMSDGTSTLHFLDPETLQETGSVEVHDAGGPVVQINELEYIRGLVYANIWQTDRIAEIDPQSGQVTAWIDLAGLLSPADMSQPVDVLNGIAYDSENDRLFVTGKFWPKLFQIELVPAAP